jgi:hypothetical protein
MAWTSSVEKEPYPLNQSGVIYFITIKNYLIKNNKYLKEFPIFFNGLRERLLCKIRVPNVGTLNSRITSGVALVLIEND